MKIRKVKPLDFALYLLMLIIVTVYLFNLDYSNKNFFVVFSFIVIGLLSFAKIVLIKRNISILRTAYIFAFIFLFMAPLQQYTASSVLWSANGMNLVYTDEDYLYTNLLIVLFFGMAEIAYKRPWKPWVKTAKKNEIKSVWSIRILIIISFACMAVAVATNGLNRLINASAILVQIRNMVLFIPAEALLICLSNWKKNNKKKPTIHLVILTSICAIVYLGYSDTMGRFMSLGVLMAIVSFLLNDYNKKSVYPFLYFVGFLFVFTAFRGNGFFDTALNFQADFSYPDYDAYQMFLMTVNYVRCNGISWGMNIISALLCFIPRSIATWRLEATGAIVISFFGSWFTNVSCPLPAECFFAFGVVGVLLLGYGIGILFKKTDVLPLVGNELATSLFFLLIGLTIYVMRGALLPAFSYIVGLLLSFFLIYRVTHRVS